MIHTNFKIKLQKRKDSIVCQLFLGTDDKYCYASGKTQPEATKLSQVQHSKKTQTRKKIRRRVDVVFHCISTDLLNNVLISSKSHVH